MKNYIAMTGLISALQVAVATPVTPARGVVGPHKIGYTGLEGRTNGCDADNCARAVTGTANGLATVTAHLQDCSSFFSFTYIPPTTTSTFTVTPPTQTDTTTQTVSVTVEETVTQTISSTIDQEVYNRKRAVDTGTLISPSRVPLYASPCSGIVRYSSACSCAGVTAQTTTLASPVVTITVTAPTSTLTVGVSVTETYQSIAATQTVVGPNAYVDQIQCGKSFPAPDTGVPYTIVCGAKERDGAGTLVSSPQVADWDVCVKAADDITYSTSFVYSLSTKTCYIYVNSLSNLPSDTTVPDADSVYAYYY